MRGYFFLFRPLLCRCGWGGKWRSFFLSNGATDDSLYTLKYPPLSPTLQLWILFYIFFCAVHRGKKMLTFVSLIKNSTSLPPLHFSPLHPLLSFRYNLLQPDDCKCFFICWMIERMKRRIFFLLSFLFHLLLTPPNLFFIEVSEGGLTWCDGVACAFSSHFLKLSREDFFISALI